MINIQDFKRIFISFADNANDVLLEKGKITGVIRDEVIEVHLIDKEGELYVIEDSSEVKAKIWIAKRLGQLEQLASRIREYLPTTTDFINPTGSLLDDIDIDPSETEKPTNNVTECLRQKLGQKVPGTTGVLYLTSDAGEGKTTVINHLAISQAELYQKKETDWLLVPIPLGGRPFLRFDDIVIASLVNRLKFRLFYYESFIELVRLGLIVPAFDGFEEMFMISSSGEALSATGQLMTKLSSSGNVLIAARQAYFDYKGFGTQAKLFDTIGKDSVAFAKISINRWSREQFEEYAISRNIEDGEQIYEFVKSRLGSENHPLLTRPVLVNRLFEVVQTTGDLDKISSALESSTEYFPKFVDAIIVREADLKWIDTSGEHKPLLTIQQHYELLAALAEEMWLNNTDSLPVNIIDLIADLYSESKGLSVQIARQVKERLKQHALIVRAESANQLKFDHQEFQEFFLGVCMYLTLKSNKLQDFKNLLRRGMLFGQTIEAIASYSKRDESTQLKDLINTLNVVQLNEGMTSYVKENAGSISLKILSNRDASNIDLENYSFPADSLNGVILKNLTVTNSYFQTTTISGTHLDNCLFDHCTFDSLETDHEYFKVENTTMRECEVLSVQNIKREVSYYDPFNIKSELQGIGFTIDNVSGESSIEGANITIDEDLEITEKALRRFIRGSQINDNVFRIRLGQNAEYFIQDLLPILLEENVINEVDYQGAGHKRRFKLMVPFDQINYALKESNGSFKTFIEKIKHR